MTCPKCASDAGWDGPKFRVFFQPNYVERLHFTCVCCGYVRREYPCDHVVDQPQVQPSSDAGIFTRIARRFRTLAGLPVSENL